jgi:hypothetical protein
MENCAFFEPKISDFGRKLEFLELGRAWNSFFFWFFEVMIEQCECDALYFFVAVAQWQWQWKLHSGSGSDTVAVAQWQ